MDEELELNGLIKHLEEAFSNMDGDYFCKVHGQAVESALAKLRQIYKPESVQYVVEIKIEEGGFYMSKLNGINIYNSYTREWVEPLSLVKINKMREAFALPPITMKQITFVEV